MKYTAFPILLVALLLASFTQERVKPKGPKDFPKTIEAISTHWQNKDFNACIKQLKHALELAVAERSATIRAALPTAPAGWTVPKPRKEAANPFAAAMSGAVGNIIEQAYQEDGGDRRRVDVTVTADSPMVRMIGMVIANPALDAEAEGITYGSHKAILKPNGSGVQLQILINELHIVDVRTNFKEPEETILFSLFNQSAVDALALALGK